MLEKGRYYGIPRAERICPHCTLKEIEDEIHFIFNCPHHAIARENLLATILANCLHFNNMTVSNKFLWLMNCEDINVLKNLCEYICVE